MPKFRRVGNTGNGEVVYTAGLDLMALRKEGTIKKRTDDTML